ncbi:unnamed protein product [Mytilus coruscus]|uniref:Uncharacterized protein n=1 Tax=Mytilus coruscus TaxID=42192 RepID=A0A6J8CLE7_MYTCO|nr:unnamed protein product [Mytilus coruscus]
MATRQITRLLLIDSIRILYFGLIFYMVGNDAKVKDRTDDSYIPIDDVVVKGTNKTTYSYDKPVLLDFRQLYRSNISKPKKSSIQSKPNVSLEVRKRPPSTGGVNCTEDAMFQTVDPYLHDLKVEGIHFPKHILYVRLKWCGLLQHRTTTFKEEVEEKEMKLYVSQYHAPKSKDVS